MNSQFSQDAVREQYGTPSNLNARIALHQRFSTSKQSFGRTVFDQYSFPDQAHILELGCGTAGQWAANRDRINPSWRVILSDLSEGMIRQTRQSTADLSRNIHLVVSDAQFIPFPDAAFDAVIANHMLYHVPDLRRCLAEIRRVLRPAGCLYATTVGRQGMRELQELLVQFDPAVTFGHDRAIRHFTVETAGQELAEFFGSTKYVPLDGELRVTEAEPLVAYALSGMGNVRQIIQGERLDEFRRYVQQRIDADGAIRIRTVAGIFVAGGT